MLFLKNMILMTFTNDSSKDVVLMMVVLAVMVSLMLFLSLLKIVLMMVSDVFTVVCVVFFVMKSHDDMKMELDCQNLDSEFGLFGCREDQKTTPDRPGWEILPDHCFCLI